MRSIFLVSEAFVDVDICIFTSFSFVFIDAFVLSIFMNSGSVIRLPPGSVTDVDLIADVESKIDF